LPPTIDPLYRPGMDRRRLLTTALAGAFAAPLAAWAQPSGRVARVGMLSVDRASLDDVARVTLLAALKDLGWIQGQNLVFEARYAAGPSDRLPVLAAELVRLKVDMIVTLHNQETLAAQHATASIPIVMLLGIYPERVGIVASLARPGGNVTADGVTACGADAVGRPCGQERAWSAPPARSTCCCSSLRPPPPAQPCT
jgi:putative ABC transport system substrate-binding protein